MSTQLVYTNITLKSLQLTVQIYLKAYNQIFRFTLHSGIADCGLWPEKNAKGQVRGHLAVQLYYLCRALDPQGSGWAEINLELAAEFLKTSIYSIRRRLSWGLNLGLFRDKLRQGVGEFKVFYCSLVKVAARLGLDDLGAITEIDLSQLRFIKFASTEAEALQLQKRSRWRESHRKSDRRRTLDPNEMTTSELGYGAILSKYGRVTVLRRSVAAYGGSQSRVAWEQGRHPATVQRRLADGYRKNHNLDPIPKTQLATAPNYEILHQPPNKPPIRKLQPGQRLIKIPGLGLFRLTCNVYSIPDNLQPKRMLRAKVKRRIQRERNADDWNLRPEYKALMALWRAENDKDNLSSKNQADSRVLQG